MGASSRQSASSAGLWGFHEIGNQTWHSALVLKVTALQNRSGKAADPSRIFMRLTNANFPGTGEALISFTASKAGITDFGLKVFPLTPPNYGSN